MLQGVSEAEITLADGDAVPAMHSLVELYTANGSAGIFRVTNIGTTYRQETTLQLRQAIDTLADATWRAQEEYNDTLANYLTKLLSFQTARILGVAPWQLGTVAATGTVKRNMNYDRLNGLMTAIEEDYPDYYFSYDFTTWPWTVSLLARPSAVVSEFRLKRNAAGVSVTIDDSEMCNRLKLSANYVKTTSRNSEVKTQFYDYENTASQAVWGVVERVADIDVHEDVSAGYHAEADAWAARFLAERGDPSVQIEIDGYDLKRYTGDDFDLTRLGTLCRVALPEYGASFDERVMTLVYPDALGDPDAVRVSLANQLPKFSESLAQVRDKTNKVGRVAARNARQTEVSSYMDLIVRDVDDTVSGVGLKTLYESGIILDARDGVRIYSIMEGLQALNSVLKISHTGVESLVTASGARLKEDGTLDLDEEGHPQFDTLANCLYSQIRETAGEITSVVVQAGVVPGLQEFSESKAYAVGDMVLHDGGSFVFTTAHPAGPWDSGDVSRIVPLSSRVTQTESNWSTMVQAIGSGGTVTAASIAVAINDGQSGAFINADHIYLTGTTTMDGQVTVDNGSFRVKTALLVTGSSGGDVSINNGTVVASTHQVRTGGSVVFVGANTGEHYDLTASNVKSILNDYIAEASVSGNVLTLKKADGTTAATFSKATTLGGAWSNGVCTVTATQNGASVATLAVTPSIRLNGSGGTSFSAEMLDDTASPTVQTSVTGYLHQSGTTVGVYKTYSGGTYSDIIASLTVSGTVPPSSHITVESNGHYSPSYTAGGTQITSWISNLRQAMNSSGYFYFDAWLSDDPSDKKRYYIKFT